MAKTLSARFPNGKRIEMHPGTDQWMMGARFGNVVRVDEKAGDVIVKLDKLKKRLRCKPEHILEKDPTKDFGLLV